MKPKLIIAGVGNYIDAIATFILTQYMGFTELNPIMAWLLQWPVLATVSKIVVITSLLIYIYNIEHNKYTSILATFAAIFYGTMGVYYVSIFIILFFNFNIWGYLLP